MAVGHFSFTVRFVTDSILDSMKYGHFTSATELSEFQNAYYNKFSNGNSFSSKK